MSTRSVIGSQSVILSSDYKLPQPGHTAIRLLVALKSFEKDKGPETGYISADLAFKMRKQVPTLQESLDLIKARSFFFRCVYAYMGTDINQSLDLDDEVRVNKGQLLYKAGCEVSNQLRAKALSYAIANLFSHLLDERDLAEEALSNRQDDCCSTT